MTATMSPEVTSAPAPASSNGAAKKATKSAKKPAKKGKVAKGAKKAAKASKPRGETIRLRVFKLLAKAKGHGLTGKQIMEKLSLGGVPSLLKDEALCKPPRIKVERVPNPNTDSEGPAYYSLTATGEKALRENKVDENAAPRTVGDPLRK